MGNESTLRRIADTARLLYTTYPAAAADLRRAEQLLHDTRADGPAKHLPTVTRHYRSIRDEICEPLGRKLFDLAAAVPGTLPEVWSRTLRIVGAVQHWHRERDFDWDAGIAELRRIESEALRLAEHGDDAPGDARRDDPAKPTRSKRSTESGEARKKIVAALTVWHKYENGGCGNTEPIKVRELARLADVGPASVNRFFGKQFREGKAGGHRAYQRTCQMPDALVLALQTINDELTPAILARRLHENVGDASADNPDDSD